MALPAERPLLLLHVLVVFRLLARLHHPFSTFIRSWPPGSLLVHPLSRPISLELNSKSSRTSTCTTHAASFALLSFVRSFPRESVGWLVGLSSCVRSFVRSFGLDAGIRRSQQGCWKCHSSETLYI